MAINYNFITTVLDNNNNSLFFFNKIMLSYTSEEFTKLQNVIQNKAL